MTIIDRGILEVAADVSGVEAGMAKAQRSIRGLGRAAKDESARTSASIDKYVKGLQTQAANFGKTARESELYRLRLRGANAAQLAAADSALRLQEKQRLLQNQMGSLRTAATRLGVVLGTGLIAAAVGFDRLVKDAANFQDVAEKMGDSAENVASLAVAAAEGGSNVDTLAQASVRLNKSLTGVDDESAAAGAAVKALGLDLAALKKLAPVDQLETVAKAMANFEDGTEKGAIAVALFGRAGAELLPTFKVLAQEGARQNILTAEQIRLADEYADAQARNTEQIKLYAEAIATDALPLLSDLTGTIAELAKDQEFAATASDLLQGAIKSAIVVFQTVAIVASDVGFVFKGVGREIGAIAAQLAALARLDFAGFSAISDAVREDAERARKELDRFQARVMGIGQPKAAAFEENFPAAKPTRPRLKFDGAVKKDKGSKAKKEANDLLNADLDEIRRQSSELEDIFDAAEKIMEARRSADLVNDREYFDAKLGFINLHQQAEEAALQKEIDRLRTEAVNDENRLAIAKKIADAEAKMTKLRVQGAAQREVLGIQEAEAIRKTTQAYVDATVAAREYLDTIAKRNQRELDGVGKGEKFRARQSDLIAIEDDLTKERQRLEREKRRGEISQQVFDQYLEVARSTYAEEVRLYNERTIAMEAKQGDWVNGFTESLSNYIDNARDVAGQSKELFDNAFQGLEDAIVKFAQTGKLSFKDLINSISADLTRMATKQILADAFEGIQGGALGDTIGGLFKGMSPKKAAGDGGLSAQTAQTSASLVTLQTTGIDPTVTSLIGLQQAADAAAAAVMQMGANPAFAAPESPALTTGDFARMDRGQTTGEQTIADLFKSADKSGQALAKTNAAAANSVLQFAAAAARGGNAMSLLPGIIQSIIAAASTSSSSGGGNFLGMLGSLFSTGSMNAAGGFNSAGFGSGAGFGNMDLGLFLSKGGYTGDGGVTESAGIVHGKEFVFSAPAVKTIGLDTLESMHRDARQGKLKDEELETISAVAGGRAIGGPVSAGGLYRVVEKGQPEVLTIGNKQFLMMGAQGGEVEPTTPTDKARADRAQAPSLIVLDRGAAVQPAGMIDNRFSERLIERQSNTATRDRIERADSNAITFDRIANTATSSERVERRIGTDRSVETSRFTKVVEGGEISLATHESTGVVQVAGGDAIGSMTIGAAVAADGRALGGPVSPNQIYRVNEEGPEILKIAGKQYLMMGDQGGQVTPGSGSKAGDSYYTVQVTATPGMTREQAMNQGREIQRGMQSQAAMRARNT